MSLSINSHLIADVRVQGITLRSVLGAYELVFALSISIHRVREVPRHAAIMGARVHLTRPGEQRQEIGFARPEQPMRVVQHDHPYSQTPTLVLPLQPGQLNAIEDFRDAADLDFELTVAGAGQEGDRDGQIGDTWRIHVPRSDWVKKLNDAGALNVLLLEVPLAIGSSSEAWTAIGDSLRRAEKQFSEGDYHACVASCRTIVQDLGALRFGGKDWSTPLLKRLANDRAGMTKEERESAIWGSLRHYTHQAHHGDSEGGELYYTRAEAKLVLALTASFIAQSGDSAIM